MDFRFYQFARVLLFSLLLNAGVVCGQTIQYGRVVEMNTQGRALTGVAVEVPSSPDCQPAVSGDGGVFRLVFSEHHPGDVIHGLRFRKYGYELVNHHVVHEGWTLTEKDTLKVVMAPEGTVSEARSRYYQYLETAYLQRFDATVATLQEQYAQQVITEREYDALMQKAVYDLDMAYQHIDSYADQLARLNADDFDGNIDQVLDSYLHIASQYPSFNESQSVAQGESFESSFLNQGLKFAESCVFLGDYYNQEGDLASTTHYYSMALHMYLELQGMEGRDFTEQINRLKAIQGIAR